MKNKGRRQLAGNGSFAGIANCKSLLVILTRPITSMGRRKKGEFDINIGSKTNKYLKKKWSKRVRGYFKSQTKELL